MPELPDIEAYLEALTPRVIGRALLGIRVLNPFLLRTVDPPLSVLTGGTIQSVSRLGKRLVLEVVSPCSDVPYYVVVHLMIAGRLQWKEGAPSGEPPEARAAVAGAGGRGRAARFGNTLAVFEFSSGTLHLTEAGSKRRASLHLVHGREALAALDRGGLEIVGSAPAQFAEALRRENHTLKRALTDPRLLSGVGNAYSDEILHRARLSPFKLTRSLSDEEMSRLHSAAVDVLTEWSDRLAEEARKTFPKKVTAFRPEMAVHGKFGEPCPVCGASVQRIVYADNECDYCPRCQTEGRILADRSLSRLLKDDWPQAIGTAEDD